MRQCPRCGLGDNTLVLGVSREAMTISASNEAERGGLTGNRSRRDFREICEVRHPQVLKGHLDAS